MEQRNMWNRKMVEEGKSVRIPEKQGTYCTKKRKRNCENVENDEKNMENSLTLGELRTMIQIWNRFHKTKCRNGNNANVEQKAVGKAFREIRREL